jgi:GT2 family glycosyltransferase
MKSGVGVLIVTYNSEDVIRRCLDSCGELPVLVVDNASSDNTLKVVGNAGGVRLIANSHNRGFAGAVNQGIEALDCEYVLLLNPDVELRTSVAALVDACSEEGVGIAAGRLESAAGQTQAGFTIRRFPTGAALALEVLGLNRLLPSNPVNRRYRYLDADLTQPADVEQPAGAFLMLRSDAWRRLGGFDTQFYPVWFEDVDYCKRARNAGLRIRYVPQVAACHQGGHSVRELPWDSREVYWYGSLLRYAAKHLTPWALRGVCAAVVWGSAVRAAAEVLRQKSLKPVVVYARIAWRGIVCLIAGKVPVVAARNCS